MAFKDIYLKGEGIEPLFPGKTDEYLRDLPPEDTFDTARKLADGGVDAIKAAVLGPVAEELRTIEVSRRRIAYLASAANKLVNDHPGALAALPSQDMRTALHDLADRIAMGNITERTTSVWD